MLYVMFSKSKLHVMYTVGMYVKMLFRGVCVCVCVCVWKKIWKNLRTDGDEDL